ncbi:piercer of microtubule wall 1 protein [Gavia stellata]|uniref:piercer of microtubule wall 1 protein n=1 Tax=Gavia stellata TaxID=37040 RepID=UPI00289A9176|nr:piercer of microtubule wall 1 protein [Gavia stellata]
MLRAQRPQGELEEEEEAEEGQAVPSASCAAGRGRARPLRPPPGRGGSRARCAERSLPAHSVALPGNAQPRGPVPSAMSGPAVAASPGPRTSDWYRTSPGLPGRFQQPACFRGYGKPEPHPRYRTTNQAYGSKAPTVHEVPTSFHVTSHAFSNTLAQCGMYRDNGLNTALEKSHVTGPDNFITAYDHLNFHPSYNPSGPSHC